MQTRGTESIFASAMPVTRLVAPGPLVAIATPTFPVTRATPSAANTAPCSCRVSTWRMPLPSSASYNGIIAPPGYPNTRSTPSARTHRRTISAPLSIHGLLDFFRSLNRLFRLLTRQPAHHAAQLCAYDLDGMLLLLLTEIGEVIAAVFVFLDPLARKGSVLNIGQSLLHRSARGVAHNFLAARQVAIFCRIRNRIAHPAPAAFVEEVDNQLHLVQTLEIGNLRRVAGFHQRLEAFLDQRSQPAAQHRLLAEKIALGFFLEGGLQHARARGADAMRVSQRVLVSPLAGILLNRNQRRHAAPFAINSPQQMTGTLGRNHHHVHIFWRNDRFEMNAKAVREAENFSWMQIRLDELLVHCGLRFIGGEHIHPVPPLGRLIGSHHHHAIGASLLRAGTRGLQADDDFVAAIAQVLRLRVSLAAVA